METELTRSTELPVDQYQALLEVSESISRHLDLGALLHDLAHRLPRVVDVNFVALSLHDPARNGMRLQNIQANIPADIVGGHEERIEESPTGLVWHTQQPLLVPDLVEEFRWPKVTGLMQEDGINSFCVVPLTTALRRLGAMGFASVKKGAYREADVEFLRLVGKQVAVAVDNVLHHQALTHDKDHLRLLLEISEAIASRRDLDELFHDLAERLPHAVQFDFVGLILHDALRNTMRIHTLATVHRDRLQPTLEIPVEESAGGLVWTTQQPLVVSHVAHETRSPKATQFMREFGIQSFCMVPLTTAMRRVGAMGFGSLQERAFDHVDVAFLEQIGKQVAVAVDNALNYETVQASQHQLARERDHLRLLLEVNNAVVSHLNLEDVFTAVSACLRKVITHDGSSLVLTDPETRQFRVHVLDFTTNTSFIREGRIDPGCKSPACLPFRAGSPSCFRRKI